MQFSPVSKSYCLTNSKRHLRLTLKNTSLLNTIAICSFLLNNMAVTHMSRDTHISVFCILSEKNELLVSQFKMQ